MSLKRRGNGSGDSEGEELCTFLRRIANTYNTAENATNVFDAYVNYNKCYEMLNAFIMLAPSQARMIPPAKCMQTCGLNDRPCNIAFFMDIVRKKAEDLQRLMAPSVEKLVLDVGSSDENTSSDESFACQSLKLPGGQDKLCETWFDDIIGLQDAKDRLQEGFIYPLLYPNLYGVVSGGVLLYGPPGTGKTMLARALINEMEFKSRHPKSGSKCSRFLYFAPTTDMLKGKYVGETEKKITDLFMGASKLACKVSAAQGVNVISVMFIDEIDGLAPSRDVEGPQSQIISSAVNTLLQMMDGVNSPKNVVVLAATNYPDSLDSAFRRRFQYQIPIDLPSATDIEEQFDLLLSKHVRHFETYDTAKGKTRCSTPTGTNAYDCARKAIESIGCDRSDRITVKSTDWKDPTKNYTTYTTARLPINFLKNLSRECYKQHYSGSDIARLFNTVIKLSASAALKAGAFYPVDDHYISINCFTHLPPSVSPKMITERVANAIRTITIGQTVYLNRFDFYQTVFPLPLGADELYVAVSDASTSFIIRYDFTVRSVPGKVFSLFAQTKIMKSPEYEQSGWWNWLRGIYTPDQITNNISSAVMGDSSKMLSGLFWVRDVASNNITYAKVRIDQFMWDKKVMRAVVERKEIDDLAFIPGDKTDSEKVMDTLMNSVAISEDDRYIIVGEGSLQYTTIMTLVGEHVDEDTTRYFDVSSSSSFTFSGYPKEGGEKQQVEMMESGNACSDWLRGNAEYVNWDMNALYFTRAKFASKSTIDSSEKTKEQYEKFKKYIQGV